VPLAHVLARIEATLGAPGPVHALVKARMTEQKLHVTEYWHDAEAHAAAHLAAALGGAQAAMAELEKEAARR
jgi:hypothetical protein